MTDPTTPNPQADELVSELTRQLEDLLYQHDPMCGGSDCEYTARQIAPVLAARITADRARIEQLEMALRDFCEAAEYWAGCDEGCSQDIATDEIMRSGGAWPSLAYDKARELTSGRGG